MIVLADVIVTFKIMPKDTGVNLDKVEAEARKKLNVSSVEVEPLAFGLSSLKMVASIPEADGASDKAEEDLGSIEGVGGVEVVSMTRDM